VPTDVTNAESVNALFAKAHATFGRIDLLFNNAGMNVPPTPLEDLAPDQWHNVVNVNLTGLFLCTQAAFRYMKSQKPQGGRIINNGSISAQAPRPHAIAYTATKCGVTGITKTTALEGRPYNIACGQIDIGNAETELTAKMRQGVLQADGQIKAEPTMHVDNVANAVVHMASLPLDANILFLTVMATNMPLVGRG
jgi:NAD(P)-dependent dehydrogenase (short-subunit alcohol dehydrogenase family)